MEQNEGKFKGRDNFNLYWRAWLPEGKPTAILLVSHGLGEHISRYHNLVNFCVPRGFAVYGLDHQGHGKSEGTRVYIDRFATYLDDLKTFFDMVRRDNPDLKIFLLGHSMGGLIATAYAVQHQDELKGLIVSAPSLKPGESFTPAMIKMAKAVSAIQPKMGIAELDSAHLSKDKSVVEAYDNDPLVYRGKITARLGAELFGTMAKLESQMASLTLPMLIMQGSADKLVNPDGGKMLYEKAGSKDKTFKIYEGLYHEIFNEPERGMVFADLQAWLNSHI
ncbi:MAG: lysophospholipase [Chloroflexi bacterium]|nr:lysophospholipase [Chloroflexota bacterium]